MDCGGTFDPVCMDFDHRPGELKLFNIAAWRQYSAKVTTAKLLTEIAKCDVVCANCHRLRTHRQRDHYAAVKAGTDLVKPEPQISLFEVPDRSHS